MLNGINYWFYEVYYKLSQPHIVWRDIKNSTINKWRLGFNPSETWSLDYSIAKFVLPRLKYFKKTSKGWPAIFKTQEDWFVEVDKMILAFEMMLNDWDWDTNKSKIKKIKLGLDSFRKYFNNLWW